MLFKNISKNTNYYFRSLRYTWYIKYLQLFDKKIFDTNSLSKLDNPLTLFMNKFYSDKGNLNFTHNYTCFYNAIFKNLRQQKLNIFEVGLGSVDTEINFHMSYSNKNYQPLASLKAWKEYFYNSEIYGADVDPKILKNYDRIKTFFVDMLDEDSIKNMWANINKKMDVIIDDGFHSFEANINFFKNSINFLNKDGFYIIEDIHRKPINIKKFFNFFKNKNINFQIIDLKHPNNIKDNCLILIKKN